MIMYQYNKRLIVHVCILYGKNGISVEAPMISRVALSLRILSGTVASYRYCAITERNVILIFDDMLIKIDTSYMQIMC